MIENREAVARKVGFVALLLGIACLTSLMDALQSHSFSLLRIVFLVVTGFLSLFFTRTWHNVRKGLDL